LASYIPCKELIELIVGIRKEVIWAESRMVTEKFQVGRKLEYKEV